MVNYGELYFDHYRKYIGEAMGREVYRTNESMPSIQILQYKNVFPECLVFNTLGLSHYGDFIGDLVEVSMVVDDAFNRTPYILANALFYCIGKRMEMGRGVAISGIGKIDQSFVEKYNKSAVYFTEPFAFPDEYSTVCTNREEKDGKMLLAFYISQAEYDFFVKHGTEEFEELLEKNHVDPFEVNRPSIL